MRSIFCKFQLIVVIIMLKSFLQLFALYFLLARAFEESTTTPSDNESDKSATVDALPFYPNLLTMAQAAVQNCYSDEANSMPIEVTDVGLKGLLNGERGEVHRDTKCLRYCIMRKNQMFNEENRFNIENMLNFFKHLRDDDSSEEDLYRVIMDCNEIALLESNRCERAHKATRCILTELNED